MKKGIWKMEEMKKYKVIGEDKRSGVGKNGQSWTISNITIDYDGKPCRVRIANDLKIQTGDFVALTIGSRRAYGGSELVVIVKDVVRQED